jgi:Outer membrane protein beta-barrel domain
MSDQIPRRSNADGVAPRAARNIVEIARLAGVIAALVLSVVPAYADGFVTPFLGFNFGGDSINCVSLTTCQEKHLNFGMSIGTTGRAAGLEEDFSFAKNFYDTSTDSSVLTIMTNVRLSLPLGPIQPYLVGGIGLIKPHASNNPFQVITSKSAFGTDLGGGLTIMFGPGVGVRGDIRRFNATGLKLLVFSGARADFWRASAGITFRY